MDILRQNINESPLLQQPADGADNLVNQYTEVYSKTSLMTMLPLYAGTSESFWHPHAPWYTESIHAANTNREKRRRERLAMHSGLTVHKQYYQEQCDLYNAMLSNVKSSYHQLEIKQADRNDLFRVVNKLTKQSLDPSLPDHSDAGDLANRFMDFYRQKLSGLGDQLAGKPVTVHQDALSHDTCSSTFSTFREVSEDEVRVIIRSSPITTCQTDPLPSTIFRESLNELLPVITMIINRSLTGGLFPSCLKHALIKPLLKSVKLNVDDFASYRPISWSVVAERSSLSGSSSGVSSRMWVRVPAVTLVSLSRHLIIIASLHPGVKWVPVRAELVD